MFKGNYGLLVKQANNRQDNWPIFSPIFEGEKCKIARRPLKKLDNKFLLKVYQESHSESLIFFYSLQDLFSSNSYTQPRIS